MPKRATPLNARQLEKWRPDPSRTLELVDGAIAGCAFGFHHTVRCRGR